jgi:hypothetical protein
MAESRGGGTLMYTYTLTVIRGYPRQVFRSRGVVDAYHVLQKAVEEIVVFEKQLIYKIHQINIESEYGIEYLKLNKHRNRAYNPLTQVRKFVQYKRHCLKTRKEMEAKGFVLGRDKHLSAGEKKT